MKIGILTSGGDCPGLNAVIRAFCQSVFLDSSDRIFGFLNGYTGLIEGTYRELTKKDTEGLLSLGGTVLGSIRQPFKSMVEEDRDGQTKLDKMKETYQKMGLDCLITLGGAGTHKTAALLAAEGCNVIGVPKTIDNDIYGTDYTFGFQTAVETAAECLEKIRTTAASHGRAMFVEIMGNKVGWLTLYAGVAGGADMILIPEIPYSEEAVVRFLKKRLAEGKTNHLIAVAEGALSQGEAALKKKDRALYRKQNGITTMTSLLAKTVEAEVGIEARVSVLGYLQRGGSPAAFDRVFCTDLGWHAYRLLREGRFGTTVAYTGGKITYNSLMDIAGKQKKVEPNTHQLLAARSLGISFGEL